MQSKNISQSCSGYIYSCLIIIEKFENKKKEKTLQIYKFSLDHPASKLQGDIGQAKCYVLI